MDTCQTGSRVKLQNSWADSCGPAIYDWVAFMSTGEKAGREVKVEKRDSQEKGKKKILGLKEILLPILGMNKLSGRMHIRLSENDCILLKEEGEIFTIGGSEETLVAATSLVS